MGCPAQERALGEVRRAGHLGPKRREVANTSAMYVQNPSGMPTLARRLRGCRVRSAASTPRPLPALLAKDVGQALRCDGDGVDTPRRVLLPNYTVAMFRESVERVARLQRTTALDLVIAYSIKTSPAPELLGLARDSGMWAEAIAQTEVGHAMAQGFSAEKIVLNGPAKWWPAPVKVPRYGAIFCDSLEELRGLCKRVAQRDVCAESVGVRLRPATVNSRFGIPLHEPAVLAEVIARLNRLPRGQGLGFHFHLASSMFGVRTWHSLAEHFLAAVGILCNRLRGRRITVSFGGGWHPDDWTDFLQGEFRRLVATCAHDLPMVQRVILEPGKALSQRSMGLLTRVLEVRRARSSVELVVDGSIAELPDVKSHPHRIVSLTPFGKHTLWGPGGDGVLGRLCMEFDILSEGVQVPRTIKAGDLLAYLDAGAY